MKLVVGLGNPGSKYSFTRHNIGFIIVDYFAEKNNIVFKPGKGDWYECEVTINDEEVFLIKPVTYMNNSGTAVLDFCESHEINPNDVFVIYDDFQLPLGTIRVRKKGSDGGHNGISDIMYQLNTDEIPRMKVGIGNDKALQKEDFIDFVLSDFTKEELNELLKIMPDIEKCIYSFISDDIKVTMNNFNKSFILKKDTPDNNTKKKNDTES